MAFATIVGGLSGGKPKTERTPWGLRRLALRPAVGGRYGRLVVASRYELAWLAATCPMRNLPIFSCCRLTDTLVQKNYPRDSGHKRARILGVMADFSVSSSRFFAAAPRHHSTCFCSGNSRKTNARKPPPGEWFCWGHRVKKRLRRYERLPIHFSL